MTDIFLGVLIAISIIILVILIIILVKKSASQDKKIYELLSLINRDQERIEKSVRD